MKLGGLLRGYHPARKCLKTGRDEERWGIKIGSADFIKDGAAFEARLEPFQPVSAAAPQQSTQVNIQNRIAQKGENENSKRKERKQTLNNNQNDLLSARTFVKTFHDMRQHFISDLEYIFWLRQPIK